MSDSRWNISPVTSPQQGRERSRIVLLWLSLGGLLTLSFLLDGSLVEAVAPLRHSWLAEFLGATVRWLGTGYVQVGILLALIIVCALFRLPALRAGAWALLGFLLSGTAASILKVLVHRPRPWVGAFPQGWSDYLGKSDFHSFPSGESTTSFALAVVLGAWFPKLRLLLIVAAAMIALARVVVGSHFPSDVVGGAVLGVAVGELTNYLARRPRARAGTPAQQKDPR